MIPEGSGSSIFLCVLGDLCGSKTVLIGVNPCLRRFFAELFSRVGRSSVIESVLAGFRLKGGAKVAELCI